MILDDIDPAWQSSWNTGAAIRMLYTRAARTYGYQGEPRDFLMQHCPGHRLFQYQLAVNGKVKSGPRQYALIRRDIGNPMQALQERYGTELVIRSVVAA